MQVNTNRNLEVLKAILLPLYSKRIALSKKLVCYGDWEDKLKLQHWHVHEFVLCGCAYLVQANLICFQILRQLIRWNHYWTRKFQWAIINDTYHGMLKNCLKSGNIECCLNTLENNRKVAFFWFNYLAGREEFMLVPCDVQMILHLSH